MRTADMNSNEETNDDHHIDVRNLNNHDKVPKTEKYRGTRS